MKLLTRLYRRSKSYRTSKLCLIMLVPFSKLPGASNCSPLITSISFWVCLNAKTNIKRQLLEVMLLLKKYCGCSSTAIVAFKIDEFKKMNLNSITKEVMKAFKNKDDSGNSLFLVIHLCKLTLKYRKENRKTDQG